MILRNVSFWFFAAFIFLSGPVRAELNPLLDKASFESATVAKVLAVNKVLLANGERLVLIGLQGPPPPKRHYVERDEHGFIIQEDNPATPMEEQAFLFVRKLLEGKTVRIEFDVERRDENGTRWAYLFLSDGRLANVEILREGYAELHLRTPNLKYADRFRAAYREARQAMKGLQGQW